MNVKSFLLLIFLFSVSTLSMASGSRWVKLFNGKNLDGWVQKNGKATYRVEDGMIIGKTEKRSPNSFLCSEKEYADFELELEIKLFNRELNSGVQIRSKTMCPEDGGQYGRVNGPQVEIDGGGAEGSVSGYLYGEALEGWMTPESELSVHKAFKVNDWNVYRIVAKGARIQIWINGMMIEDLTDEKVFSTHPKGFIGLQVHGVDELGPFEVAWRNIRIKELTR